MSRYERYMMFRSPAMILLLIDLFQIGIWRIPLVTLSMMFLQIALFLHIPVMLGFMDTAVLSNVCLVPENIVMQGNAITLFTAPLFHIDDWHLYFNTVSFISKAPPIERHFGTLHYSLILVELTALTGVIHTIIALVLDISFDSNYYGSQCSLGFSGVIFALKIVSSNLYPNGYTQWIVWQVKNSYSSVLEVLLIQYLSPDTSLIGHLAGIIAGMLFINLPTSITHYRDTRGLAASSSMATASSVAKGYDCSRSSIEAYYDGVAFERNSAVAKKRYNE